jgi:hypothetical protein
MGATYYAQLGRVVVSFNEATMRFTCPCSIPKKARKGAYGLKCPHAKVRVLFEIFFNVI